MGPGARSFSFRISHATRPVQDKILKGESFKALIEKHTAMGSNCCRQFIWFSKPENPVSGKIFAFVALDYYFSPWGEAVKNMG